MEGEAVEEVGFDDLAFVGGEGVDGRVEAGDFFGTDEEVGGGGLGVDGGAFGEDGGFDVADLAATLGVEVFEAVGDCGAGEGEDPGVEGAWATVLEVREELPGALDDDLEEVLFVGVGAEGAAAVASEEEEKAGSVAVKENLEGSGVAVEGASDEVAGFWVIAKKRHEGFLPDETMRNGLRIGLMTGARSL